MILKTPNYTKSSLLVAIMFAVSQEAAVAAVDCSKESVAYYLKQGVATEKVLELCGGKETKPLTAPAPALSSTITAPVGTHITAEKDDLLFFSSMIVADKVELKGDHLVYVKKDCIKYGEEVEEDVPEYACGNFYTSINRKGLKIVEASQGLPLIKDTELIVKGDIKRKVLDFEKLHKDTRKMLKKLFVPTPEQLEIPLRKDANAEEVGYRLRAF